MMPELESSENEYLHMILGALVQHLDLGTEASDHLEFFNLNLKRNAGAFRALTFFSIGHRSK